jgi:hypothetical protein
VSAPLLSKIRASLTRGRADADALLDSAEEEALALSRMADATDRALAEARLERLHALREEIDTHQRQIEAAFVAMSEALATAALRLTLIAREADFSPPPMRGGITHAFELKLSQTREVTFRVAPSGSDAVRAAPPV